MATIQGIYIALFGRPADPLGLEYFNDVTSNGANLAAIGDLAATDEYQDRFEGLSNTQIINSIYQSLFGRDADLAGLTFFAQALQDGTFNINNIAIAILDGAQGDDLEIVNNKIEAANLFTASLDTGAEVVAYQGDEAAAAGRALLMGITSDDATIPTQAQVDAAIVAIVEAAGDEAFTLTEGVDVATSNVFNAPRGFTPGGTDQVNTLDDDDVLTGVGTNPTLNFTFVDDADTGDLDIAPTLNGIETINIEVRVSFDAELDLQDSTGVQNINVSGIDDNLAFSVDNIQSADVDLSINDSNDDGAEILFQFDTDAVDGTADEVDLVLNDVDVDLVSIDDEDDAAGLGVETLNVVSTGDSNEVSALNAEDLETLNITGDENLSLGSKDAVVRAGGTAVEAFAYNPGLLQVAGSLDLIDASGLDADLSLTLGDEVTAAKDGTSGGLVDFVVKTGSGDDMIRLTEGFDSKGDSIDAGAGANTLFVYNDVANGSVTNVQTLDVRATATDTISVDSSLFTGLEEIQLRNEGQAGLVTSAADVVFELNELTDELAQNISIQHSTTGSNGLTQNTIDANLADATGDSDTVAVAWADQIDMEARGINNDPRFNFELDAEDVENISLDDMDSESNTVDLVQFADHTGTLTVTGGQAGQFLNLDIDAQNSTGAGIYEYDASGDDVDGEDIGDGNVGSTRLVFETIDAGSFKGDFIARMGKVDTEITTGTGNDTIVFDDLNSKTAGLSIADTVALGEGNDTIAIDGEFAGELKVGASEWTNLSGVDNIRLVDNDLGTYRVTLTDQLVEQTDGGTVINIINDNDPDSDGSAFNDESDVVIDARSLSADKFFTYDGGEVGKGGLASTSNDRFIVLDAQVAGGNVIDGGYNNYLTTGPFGNGDVLEIRNNAVVTIGDLENVSNIGTLEFVNDTAAPVTALLELDDATIDRLVNSNHTATDLEEEHLVVNVQGNGLVPGATHTLTLDTTGVDGDVYRIIVNLQDGGALDFTGSASLTLNGTAGADVIVTGDGNDVIDSGDGNDNITTGDGDDVINAGTGNNIVEGGAGADTFVFDAGESRLAFLNSFTIIEDFVSGEDQLDVVGTGADYAEADAGGVLPGDFATLIANATAAMNGGNDVYVAYNAFNSGDAFVFVDDNGNGTYEDTETFIQLIGVNTAGEISGGDFV